MRAIHLSLVTASSLLAGGMLMLASAGAQTTVATNPVGFTTLTIAAKPSDVRGFTYLSLNMVRPAVYRGLIPANSATGSGSTTTLAFPAATFTNGQFDGTRNHCYLEVTNGTVAGITADITTTVASDSNQGGKSTITLGTDISSVISTSGTTTFVIRPHWTFETVFGATNSAGLLGNTSPTTADTIQVANATNNSNTTYYFNTTSNKWQQRFVDASDTVIPPGQGLLIERLVNSPVSFTLVGDVKLGNTAVPVNGGFSPAAYSIVPNPYPVSSVTLAASNLYTGNAQTGVLGGTSPTVADNVSIIDPATGVFTSYYYNTMNNHWQNRFNDASNVVIPPGISVLVTRRNSGGSFYWYQPTPLPNL